jgi:hypothetical protein
VSEFRVGERYRIGLARKGAEFVRDDWTGQVVVLEAPWFDDQWQCRLEGVELPRGWDSGVILSEERLRASARLQQ